MGRRWSSAVLAFSVAVVGLPFAATPSLGSTNGVVISEFRFRGPAGGNDEFVELLNTSAVAVDVSGWKLQGCASTTGLASDRVAVPSGTSLASGQHYLFVNNNASGGYSGAVPGDRTYGTGFTDGAGARIVDTIGAVVDGVGGTGIGGTQCREGTGISGMPTANGDNSYERLGGGSLDTDNNATDFAGPKPGNPENRSSTGDAAPAVSGTSPAGGASSVAFDANVAITFSEPVSVGPSWYAISCGTSGSHAATASGGPTAFTLDPTTDFVGSETCTVTVFAAQVTDQDANDPPDNMATDFVLSFSTIAPATRIHTIQGASHRSPLVGTLVLNVPGIVTAKASNGFYIQDPTADADPATSEALFVFTSSAPLVTVGDAVSAKGTVQEFRPGGAATTNLTTTELGNPGVGVTVLSSGNPLPPTIVIGVDRIPPTEVIEDDATGSVETSGVFDPSTDGIDFWESLEAMRLQLNDAEAVGPRNNFGEIAIVAAGAGIRTTRGGIEIRANDYNPERVIIDDVLMATPSANTGDKFAGATIGVLDYSFGNFKLLVTSLGTLTSGGIAREVTTAPSPGQLAVATFNVENLDPSDGTAQFAALAALIVNNLRSPDLIALEEIQDNNGAVNDSVVDASVTLAMLRDAVVAAGGPAYAWRLIDPVDDQDGGEPGGNIRQGFFFRTDRGLSFVDRPGGTSTSSTGVVAGPGGPQLTASPGRIDPTNPAFTTSRKPLAGEFLYNSRRLFVVANHFNSKGGDQPLFGHPQPPVRSSEVQRVHQAEVVADFVSQILALDDDALVAVIGDLNDFEFSPALSTLEAAGLTTLIETLPQSERYSYVFDGNSQTLDHMQVSAGLLSALVQFDSVHVNAEFADQISDHDPQAARFGLAVTTGALCALVRLMVEKEGIASALCAKLEAAAASEARDDAHAKAGQIGAFINQVNAQRGKSVSDADATRLIELAEML
jgi:hypothetical protein